MSKEFAQVQAKLMEAATLAGNARIDLVYFLGHYGCSDSYGIGGMPSVRVAINEDHVHRMLDVVRDIVLFTPIEVGTDPKSDMYLAELKDLLFRWHNHTHTDKLVEKDGRYEWVE
jgi:hypothetical protein